MSAYVFKSGSQLPAGLDATAIGTELEALAARNGGTYTPAQVVAQARSRKSALHGAFDWDLTGEEAIAQVLEQQARYLIRSLEVVIERFGPDEPRSIDAVIGQVQERGFVQVTRRDDVAGYMDTETALRDPEYRSQVLGQAVRDFVALRRKYARLTELAAIFEAIDAVTRADEAVAV